MAFRTNALGKKEKVDRPKKSRQGNGQYTKYAGTSRNTSGKVSGSSGQSRKAYRGQGR